jgi:hypothetical protein
LSRPPGIAPKLNYPLNIRNSLGGVIRSYYEPSGTVGAVQAEFERQEFLARCFDRHGAGFLQSPQKSEIKAASQQRFQRSEIEKKPSTLVTWGTAAEPVDGLGSEGDEMLSAQQRRGACGGGDKPLTTPAQRDDQGAATGTTVPQSPRPQRKSR